MAARSWLCVAAVLILSISTDALQIHKIVRKTTKSEKQDVAVHNRNDVNIKFPHKNPYIDYTDSWEDPFLRQSYTAKEAKEEEDLLKQQLEAVPFDVPSEEPASVTVEYAKDEQQELKDIAQAEHLPHKTVEAETEGMAFGQPGPEEQMEMIMHPKEPEPDTINLKNNNVVWHRG